MAKFAAIHPGEILKREFLDELGVTAYAFSTAIDMNRSGFSDISNGERAITAASALRFARFFRHRRPVWPTRGSLASVGGDAEIRRRAAPFALYN